MDTATMETEHVMMWKTSNNNWYEWLRVYDGVMLWILFPMLNVA